MLATTELNEPTPQEKNNLIEGHVEPLNMNNLRSPETKYCDRLTASNNSNQMKHVSQASDNT